jgi:hypothetical protein
VRSSGVVYGNNHFNVVSSLTMTGGAIEQGNLRTMGNVVVGASANGSRVNGSTLDFAGGVRTFDVADGAAAVDLDISAHVRNGGINKAGDGATRLGNVNQGTLGTTVTAGTLILAHPSAAGAGTLAVGAGGSAVVQAGLPAALRVAGGLSITSPGTLDLADNDMVIDYTGASPVASIRAMLQAGYAGGAWDGGGSGGIVTADGTSDGLSIGYAEATDIFTTFPASFCGQSVDDTTLLLRFTRYGDANLDGQVNLQDFNRLAANFGTGGAWSEGDFNYDGTVNLQDFNRLAANFGLSASGPDVTPGDWANLASAVPEPACGAAALFGAALLRRARARRQ